MSYPFTRAIADDLRVLRLVYKLSTRALDAHVATLPPTQRSWETFDHADQYILESTNEQLNRVVDSTVISAYQLLRTGWTVKETRFHRAEIIRRIEDRFGIDVTSFPGWNEVRDMTRDANATKHRAGIHWENDASGVAVFDGTVQLHRATVERRIHGVGRWVRFFAATLPLS
jgi:hypothetical protein